MPCVDLVNRIRFVHGHTKLIFSCCFFFLITSLLLHRKSSRALIISKTIYHFASSSSSTCSCVLPVLCLCFNARSIFPLAKCGRNETETPNHIKLNFPFCIYFSIPYGFCFSLLLAIIETYVVFFSLALSFSPHPFVFVRWRIGRYGTITRLTQLTNTDWNQLNDSTAISFQCSTVSNLRTRNNACDGRIHSPDSRCARCLAIF